MRHVHNWTGWTPDGIGWSRRCVSCSGRFDLPTMIGCGAFQYRKNLPWERGVRQKPRPLQEWIDELQVKFAQDLQQLAKPRRCGSCGGTVAASRAYRKLAALGMKLERVYKGVAGDNPGENQPSAKRPDVR